MGAPNTYCFKEHDTFYPRLASSDQYVNCWSKSWPVITRFKRTTMTCTRKTTTVWWASKAACQRLSGRITWPIVCSPQPLSYFSQSTLFLKNSHPHCDHKVFTAQLWGNTIKSSSESCTLQVKPVLLNKVNSCQDLTMGHTIVPFTLGQCPTCKCNGLFCPILKLLTLPQFDGLMHCWLTQTFDAWSGRPKANWHCSV